MTSTTDPQRNPNYKRRQSFIILASLAAGMLVSFNVVLPALEKMFEDGDQRFATIAKDYGVQEASWGRYGIMYVKVDGKNLTCGQLSDAELANHKPIKCSDGTVIQRKNG
jgi:hypothetical protein